MTVDITPIDLSNFFVTDAPPTVDERIAQNLGIKTVGENEEQFLDHGVTVQPMIARPGFVFNDELQVPIDKINAPVPVVTYPFPVIDLLLEPRHFASTEFRSETPAALGGTNNNLTNPQSPVIPPVLFMGTSSGTDSGLPVDASTAESSAVNQSAQLKRAAFGSLSLGVTAFVILAGFLAVAIIKQ